MTDAVHTLKGRFRGFYPVVIDVETAGFNAKTDALLEIAAYTLKMDEQGWLVPDQVFHFHVRAFRRGQPGKGCAGVHRHRPLQPVAWRCLGKEALTEIFKGIRKGMKEQDCGRAIIVAHNATFDHGFVMAAAERAGLKRNPFHPFATFDTAALSGLALGQTVLAKACQSARIPFDNKEAHSALYDTERTTELFCHIVNRWKSMGVGRQRIRMMTQPMLLPTMRARLNGRRLPLAAFAFCGRD